MSSGSGHDHASGSLPARPKELAMHFDTLHNQFQSGKLGMWLFLGQELLFFAGLFTAYAVYRGNHTEMFHVGQYFLDWKMGGLNTLVLLFSSLTAAWSVRCAQLEQRKGLMITIAITWLCALTFMIIKYFEYTHKIHIGAIWGGDFHVHRIAELPQGVQDWINRDPKLAVLQGEEKLAAVNTALGKDGLGLGTFFAVYFCMTGLHGIHVLVGMGIYIWLFMRASKGVFNRKYYSAVDNVALYWHIVDMIWIFLFPLLYLIG
jgi:cytochrome c oxidase subunit 3